MTRALTLLIFSRNDTDKARELVLDMMDYVAETVIIDSSEENEHVAFKKWVETIDSAKIKIYYTVPLGYPDMLRPYALTKCGNEWVFMLDADERAPQFLKDNFDTIIDSNLAEVYAILRYTGNKDGQKLSNLRSAQVRLFKKDFLNEKGIIHKLPTSARRYMVLPEKYYILHLIEEKTDRSSEYDKMDIFSRLTYSDLPKKYKNFVKYFVHLGRNIPDNVEISKFDYMLFYLSKEVYSALVTRNFRRLVNSIKFSLRKTKRLAELKTMPKSELFFEISREINRTGLVKFLNFDDPTVVDKVNIQYKNGKLKGGDLLCYLVENRYQELKKIR